MDDAGTLGNEDLHALVIGQLATEPGFLLLTLLDTYVAQDSAPAGFTGKLAVGVMGRDGALWWRASFGKSCDAGFALEPSEEDDAQLLVGEVDARAALDSGRLPAEPMLLQLSGDRSLLDAFVKRYLSGKNWLTIRM